MTKKPLKQGDKSDLQQQVADLTDALLRERADSINIRRRSEQEKMHLAAYYKASVIKSLLPVIDSIERATKHIPKDLTDNDFIKGIVAVVKQLEKALSDLGIERIKTVGQPFDPRFHEAVVMEDGDGTVEIVSEELQAGYRLGDEVIRHAMVKVKMK